jgi:hypothetical protein
MRLRFLALILSAFFIITCKQDPIFYIIAKETAPRKPLIEGAPTNMVLFEWNGAEIMVVASGRLHWYAQTKVEVEDPADPDYPLKEVSRWDLDEYAIPQPGGKVISLAVTTSRLYALCFDDQDVNTTLRYIEPDGTEWQDIPSVNLYPLQSIYADPDKEQLFAGGGKGGKDNEYAIFYLDNDNELQPFKNDTNTILSTHLLSGAVYRDSDSYFYLCTRGEFFKVHETTFAYEVLAEKVFMGMIKLDDKKTVIAIERHEGFLYEIKADGSLDHMKYTITDNNGDIATGKWATGAFGLWEDYLNPDRKMLIAGVQGGLFTTSSTSYSHGYVEFELKSDKSFDYGTGRRETNGLQSVDDAERYTTSLGRHPINHLFQAPKHIDKDMTFFASTQTAGLWSYRDRPDNDGWQWNAEE